jgi:hypothetical protein
VRYRILQLQLIVAATLFAFFTTANADYKSAMSAYKRKDYSTALREFKADGNAISKYNVGIMYYKGEGVGQDKKLAAEWLKKAAEQGYPQAQFVYSAMNFTADGIERSIPEGVKWMRKAAENGLAEAQFRLGMMYINGDNLEKNRETGIKWVKKAAKQGHVNAKKLLKVMEEN